MKNLKLSAAVAALVAVMAISSAQSQSVSAGTPLAPAPGTVVKVGSMSCLLTNAQDRTAWCADYGKTTLPACVNPVVIDRELQCADGFARRK